ncbi:hypothetical protein [Nonomuraea sp. NPDC049400]|uniref:hypothetical protein n=1 Tax=Nonomuraea sp. NPDC049400 TaxID=3364352 RepID=UPI0037978907
MGQVYLATTPSGRRLAVKVIHAEYARNAEFRQCFQQEVAAVERVQSAQRAPRRVSLGFLAGTAAAATRTREAAASPSETSAPEQTPTATEDGAVGSKPPGKLLGTYKGIDVTADDEVSFTNDPMHPKTDGGDLDYYLCADNMAILAQGERGTYQACVDNTRYTKEIPIEEAKGKLICTFTDNTIGLVKVTNVVDSTSDYLTMDLMVWQR